MNDSKKISTLIVDDEPIARDGLRHLLHEVDWIHCVGDASNGIAAIDAIETYKPELVFLDIEMPGLSGTELLPKLRHRPFVVFTTAYAQHAVTAFELGALDYLLKPFGEERLRVTLERVRAGFGEPRSTSLARFGETMNRAPMSRVFVRIGRTIVPVSVDDILWFEAVGDYIVAQTLDAQHLLHVPLAQLEERLDQTRFLRTHRTYIVNLDQVTAFRSDANGHVAAEMKNGARLPISRSKARELRERVREK